MAIQGFFTGDVKIRELNGVLKAVNGIVEVASDAGTVTSVGLAVGSTGTDVNVANSPITSSGNITLNLPTASATNRGLLSSADWAIFSAKQGTITLTTTGNNGSATLTSGTLNIPTYTLAGLGGISLTSLSASSPLLYNNTTGAFSIQVANGSQNGYLSSTDWTTFNSKQSALTFSAPLVNTSGTVSIPAATSSVNGYLTSTDWTTFNAKQGAITLTTTGSSGASTLIGTTLNIPNYGSALTGYVPYTGATGAVDLGAFDLTVQTLTIGKGNSSLANNTALGYRTLFHITTGNYNTAVGYESSHNITTGQYNTTLGQSALFTNTTGSQNTAIGLNALLYNTSGGSNVVVGLDAMQHNTTGSSNTALGYNAGSHITGGSTPNTTASNSIYIGRDTKAKVDGGTNEIVIGYNAVGNGSNTATFGNTSTTANYFTGSINGGSFVKIGGTSSQFLKADGSVDSSTYYLASNPSAFIALTALSATAPLSYSNTTGVFSISQATTSTDGYLSSTDWNTFYNKQTAGSYITALTGEATATGPGSASVTLSTSAVTGKLLTGLNLAGGGTIAATDSILQAFGKVQNQISGMVGGVTFQGTWDASTNTPTLTSSVGTKGYYYIVSVAGSTNLNGITDWKIGDWAIFNGTTWDKVDNTDAVSSVNGFTGAVSLTTSNIAEGTNLYYLDSRARLALSFTAGSGAYDNTTGVITIPTNTSQLTNGANFITLSSLSASSPLAYNSGTGAFSIQVATGSQNGYLSSTDWTTFNGKQNALTLTTTGSSGSATLVGATLNVPTYTLSGLGGVPTSRQLTINGTAYDLSADRSWSVGTHTGSLTSGYIPKATGTTSLADSLVYDAGTAVLIGTTTASTSKFMVYSTTADNHYQAIGSAPSFRFADTITSPTYTGIVGLATASNHFIIGAAAGDMVLANNTTSSLGNFLFGTGTTERMRITPTGNVSINNTNNTYRFDVNGTVRFTGQLRLESTITNGTYTYTLPSATGTIALTSDISGMITGSGTTNYLPKFTGASTIGNSAVQTDSTGNLMVGSANSGNAGTINVSVGVAGTTAGGLQLWAATNQTHFIQFGDGTTGAQVYAGYMAYAHSTDSLLFGTNGADKMFLNSSGNLGLGVTPSAWGTAGDVPTAFQFGASGMLYSYKNTSSSGSHSIFGANAYFDGSGFKYINTNSATYYRQYEGTHAWLTAPSGTAGNAISFTQAMTLDANGRLGIGTTSPGNYYSTKLVVGVGDEDGITIAGSGDNFLMFADGQTGLDRYRGFIHYNHDSNFLAFGSDGVERLRIASTGAATFSSSVTATSATLSQNTNAIIDILTLYNVSATSAGVRQKFQNGFGDLAAISVSQRDNGALADDGQMQFQVASNSVLDTKMTILNTGNVGIGTTSPSYILHAQATSANVAYFNRTTTDGDILTLAVGGNNAFVFNTSSSVRNIQAPGAVDMTMWTNNTERMRITSGGDLIVGATSIPGAGSSTTGVSLGASGYITAQRAAATVGYFGRSNDGELFAFYNNTTQVGNISVAASSTSYNTSSDYRLKQDLKDFSGLDLVTKIKIYDYEWKADKTRNYGVIAHELQSVINYAVTGVKDGKEMQGVDYSKIVPVLIKAIQEQQTQIEQLKNK